MQDVFRPCRHLACALFQRQKSHFACARLSMAAAAAIFTAETVRARARRTSVPETLLPVRA